MSTSPNASDVLVVGGGMAGLAAAIGQRTNGASVTLVERAPEFGEVGAGLQLAPNATRLLKRWGLLEKVVEIGVKPRHLVFRDALTGEELARQDVGAEFQATYGAPYVVVHRPDLHRILVEECHRLGVELVNGVEIEKVETAGDSATAFAANGETYRAGVVLGADGIRSALRPAVSDDQPVGSAYVAYRGTRPIAEVENPQDLEDVVVYLGPNCHLVQYPLRKGELLNTVAVFKSPSFERGIEQVSGVAELEAELQEAYKDCVPEVRNSLKNLTASIRWPMYDRDPIRNWIDGRMVLVGDAAHPMLQYLAQGACQAFEDAAVLQDVTAATVFAGEGVDAGAWDAALSAYNTARAERTATVQRTARVWGESWHVEPGIARSLRNTLFRNRGDDYRYTDWLYGKDAAPGIAAAADLAEASA